MRPLAIDLFCGLGGWTDGLLAEGYDVIGFDIERHHYGDHRYPGHLVIQDVTTLHGSQFKNAALIVASPPCQEYSYMAMPWSLAKAKAKAIRADTTGEKLAALNRLFNQCSRIQKEASFAAGRHIPLIVENVRGAQPWVGRARWNFGSFYLWGDVPALMPIALMSTKVPMQPGGDSLTVGFQQMAKLQMQEGTKVGGFSWSDHGKPGYQAKAFNGEANKRLREEGSWFGDYEQSKRNGRDGIKCGGDWFNASQPSISRMTSSKSPTRKMASAMIAKIPLSLSRYIGSIFRHG